MISPAGAEHYFSIVYPADQPFDLKQLQSVTGVSKIATPDLLPVKVEKSLKQSGQYTPSFYCFHIAVLDSISEGRKIEEVNRLHWALIPKGVFRTTETPENTAAYLGFALPYHVKRRPYVAGLCFDENLRANWRPVAALGEYQIYRRNDLLDLDSGRRCFARNLSFAR